MNKVKTRVVQKHDTQANWEKAINFIPYKGEIIIYDVDESHDSERMKIGDGVSNVNSLSFVGSMEDATIETDKSLTKPDYAADAEAVGTELNKIREQVEGLYTYEKISSLAFNVYDNDSMQNTFEQGKKIYNLCANWNLNKVPTELIIADREAPLFIQGDMLWSVEEPITDTTKFVLVAKDEKTNRAVAEAWIKIYPRVFFGAVDENQFQGEAILTELSSLLTERLDLEYRLTAKENEKLTLAFPNSLPQPIGFKINGLTYKWVPLDSNVLYTNEYGHQEVYTIWQNSEVTPGTFDVLVII